MVTKNYNFDYKLVRVNGTIIREKSVLVHEILFLLSQNGYKFHPISRPVPSIIKNFKDVTYPVLARLLRHLYEYCICFTYSCLDDDVVVLSDGVHHSSQDSRCVIVEELADNWINSYPLPLSQVSFAVRQFLDKSLPNSRILVY